MAPVDPDKSIEPATPPNQVDASLMFQKDPEPVVAPISKNPFLLLGKQKTLIILASIVVIVIGGGLVFANLGKNDNARTSQEAQGQQPDQNSADLDNESPSQTSPDQTVSSPGNVTSTTTNNTTAQSSEPTSNAGTSNGSTTPTSGSGSGTSSTVPKTYNISYTNSCYSPANVTIKKGDTVKFTNNSNKKMEPASNDHPSHELYPEFDANDGISPGGTYSFTFTNTGSWGYHDHLKPSCGGTITVQ